MSQETPNPSAPDYGTPPPPPAAEPTVAEQLREPPQMNPVSRLVNVFFDPGEVFRDVRRSPRDWYLPIIVLMVIATGVGYFLQARLNLTPERLAAAQTDVQLQRQNKSRKDLTEQEKQQYEMGEKIAATFIRFGPVVGFVFLVIGFAVISLIYWVLLMLFQAKTTFFRIFSVVAYAYYAPNVIKTILQFVLGFIMDPETVDPMAYLAKGGLISASPAAFFSPTEQSVLFTLLSFFDVFSIWYLILVAVGLSVICLKKLNLGTAMMVPVIPYLIMMIGSTLLAMAF